MIIYSPLDGDAITSSIPSNPKSCFLMTRIGIPIPPVVDDIRVSLDGSLRKYGFSLFDASTKVTGRDFLLKIWKMIASSPLTVGIVHHEIPEATQSNIYYELGVAQALGKETLLIKTVGSKIPSDFIRTEYIEYSDGFSRKFEAYLDSIIEQAEHYELIADQLDRNPILAIDYLKRAFLISGEDRLKKKASVVVSDAGLQKRAANSVELIAAAF